MPCRLSPLARELDHERRPVRSVAQLHRLQGAPGPAQERGEKGRLGQFDWGLAEPDRPDLALLGPVSTQAGSLIRWGQKAGEP
eukprot:3313072-Lingulodinium_polyedra.AAC.1